MPRLIAFACSATQVVANPYANACRRSQSSTWPTAVSVAAHVSSDDNMATKRKRAPERRKARKKSRPRQSPLRDELPSLTADERIAVDDFLLLLERMIERHKVYVDPGRGVGGDSLTAWEVEQLRKQFAPDRLILERALLALGKRAAVLRQLMRPDPNTDHNKPLPPGMYKQLLQERLVRGADELWQSAVSWITRALEATHEDARDQMVIAIQSLVERRLVTSEQLARAHRDGHLRLYIDEHFDHATSKRARRRKTFAVRWLASLTKVAENTILDAVKRAKKPRYAMIEGQRVVVSPLGTTLEQREQNDATLARVRAEVEADVRAGRLALPQPITRLR
jgi:hypothetical protein